MHDENDAAGYTGGMMKSVQIVGNGHAAGGKAGSIAVAKSGSIISASPRQVRYRSANMSPACDGAAQSLQKDDSRLALTCAYKIETPTRANVDEIAFDGLRGVFRPRRFDSQGHEETKGQRPQQVSGR